LASVLIAGAVGVKNVATDAKELKSHLKIARTV